MFPFDDVIMYKCIIELTQALERDSMLCFYVDWWFVAAQLQLMGEAT